MIESAAKWVVNVKGSAGDENFEISVLRDDNEHGKKSYGWFDDAKLMIASSGGPCHWKLSQIVWDKAVMLAHEVACELNANEWWGGMTGLVRIEVYQQDWIPGFAAFLWRR